MFSKMSLTELKVIEPIRNYSKEFDTPDEFNIFYAKNKDEIDKQTTHKLNKLYHIKGYRITRIKNILMLKKDYEIDNKTEKSSSNIRLEDIIKDIEMLKEKVDQIIEFLNSGQSVFMKQSGQSHTLVSPPFET